MSDDDFESQLLAVVGVNKEQKSSSKSSKKKTTKRRKKKKDSSDEEGEIEESEDDALDEEFPSKPLKKRKMDDDEFSEEEKFDDGWDEDLKGDSKDREFLDSLPEIEREQILADRYQKRQELLERFKLKQKMRREKDIKEGKRRTPSRTKIEKGNKTSALNDLKKKRARANQAYVEESSESEEIKDEPEDSDDEYIIKEDKERSKKARSEDVSVDEARVEHKEQVEEAARPVTLEELLSISLKRDFIERKIDEPYFDKLVENCFVRIGIGVHNERPVYRVAQIVEVREGQKKYKIGEHKTSKIAVLKHGSSSKTFTFEFVSNHRVQESEFKKWVSEMKKNNLIIITNQEAAKKNKELKESRNYVYTTEDVEKMVEHKKELKGKPTNIAAEKVRLITLRDACKDLNDTEQVEKLQKQIDELDQMTKEGKTTFDKAFWINQRNQQTNQARSDVSEIRGAYFSAHPELDPFSRRQTKPTNVISWLLKEKEDTNDLPKEEQKESTQEGTKKDENKNWKPKEESDIDPETLLKQAHDFDLILDAPPEALMKSEMKQEKQEEIPKAEKRKQKRPTLSVDDYKRRMGLI